MPVNDVTTSVISSNQATAGARDRHLKGNLKLIKRLSPIVQVLRRGESELFVRYTFPNELRWMAVKQVKGTEIASRHPNYIMPLLAVKHRDGSVDIDTEYADAGPLSIYMTLFPRFTRAIIAKSVAKQVLSSLLYFDNVHNMQHRNICPTTIFLRRDGCVKVGCYDLIDPTVVKANPDWYIDSPYCAPENRSKTAKERCKSDAKADVWSVGVLLFSIMVGRTLQPKNNKTHLGQDTEAATEDQEEYYRVEKAVFEHLWRKGTEAEWKDAIPDDELRHLVRWCLEKDVNKRASLAEALALIHLFGGIDKKDDENAAVATKQQNHNHDENDDENDDERLTTTISRPHPWATKKIAHDSSSIIKEHDGVRSHLEKALATPFNLGPEYDNGKLKNDANILRGIPEVLRNENLLWRETRSVETQRSQVDKNMRDVIRDRDKLAWQAMHEAVVELRKAAAESTSTVVPTSVKTKTSTNPNNHLKQAQDKLCEVEDLIEELYENYNESKQLQALDLAKECKKFAALALDLENEKLESNVRYEMEETDKASKKMGDAKDTEMAFAAKEKFKQQESIQNTVLQNIDAENEPSPAEKMVENAERLFKEVVILASLPRDLNDSSADDPSNIDINNVDLEKYTPEVSKFVENFKGKKSLKERFSELSELVLTDHEKEVNNKFAKEFECPISLNFPKYPVRLNGRTYSLPNIDMILNGVSLDPVTIEKIGYDDIESCEKILIELDRFIEAVKARIKSEEELHHDDYYRPKSPTFFSDPPSSAAAVDSKYTPELQDYVRGLMGNNGLQKRFYKLRELPLTENERNEMERLDEKYECSFTLKFMNIPVSLSGYQINFKDLVDYLETVKINPFTNEKFEASDLKPCPEVVAEIEKFIAAVNTRIQNEESLTRRVAGPPIG